MPYFIHVITRRPYMLLGHAKCAKTAKDMVLYKQLFDSTERETGEYLPKGTMWTRDAKEWNERFVKVHRDQM